MSHNQSIIIQNLTYQNPKSQLVFNNLNLTLSNIKTGLIGKNGIGKSTLLKLIINELKPTAGSVKVLGKIGYCPQDFSCYHDLTIAQFFEADMKLQALENILKGSVDPNDFAILGEDWNIKERITKQATKFCFNIKDLQTKIGTLSNGEITKLWLSKAFYQESQADFLILDEPTNNLDKTARNILYHSIQTWPGGMLIISHDQQLLELMDQTLALTEHGARIYGGSFSFYQEQEKIERAAKELLFNDAKKSLTKAVSSTQASHEKHEQNQAKGHRARKKNDQPKAMLDFAENRSGRTQQTLSKRSIRLINTAEQELQQAKSNLAIDYNIQVSLPKTFVPNDKIVANIENISFRYSSAEPYLLHDFNLTICGPEYIAISGDNGSGKTTLLKLIQKIIEPESGVIKVNITANYLDQKLEILDQQLSILDNYKNLNPKVSNNEAHKNLASFLFRNEAVLQKIGNLSCGEKIRAALACVLLAEKPPELLMLDEPTNHLDLENLRCLESILKNYEGALIIISHDQKFLEKLEITKTIYAPFV
ncbi:MAG: ATP-binding cassette domain-containing protein [Gammaproteobacteria bacterium]|nr:ATP-binding cassette domain-containing protein [Gammaproteobacteria bacterium]